MNNTLGREQLVNELCFVYVECQRMQREAFEAACQADELARKADARGDAADAAYQRGVVAGLKRGYGFFEYPKSIVSGLPGVLKTERPAPRLQLVRDNAPAANTHPRHDNNEVGS